MRAIYRIVGVLFFSTLFACSSGGGSASSSGSLQILSTNIFPNQTWPINGCIELRFNKPVDLSSVNFSTVGIVAAPPASILAPAASPVHGVFFAKPGSGGEIVVFQPACPTLPDNSNGGLMPGNGFGSVVYTLSVLGGSNGAEPSVRAADGSKLGNSYAVGFQTPTGYPYYDPVPSNPPQPLPSTNFPSSLGLNLAIAPNDPLILILDQPVQAYSIDDQSVRFEFIHPQTGQTALVPAKISLTANCNELGQAILTVIPLGTLPPGETLRVYLSKNVRGMGESDQHPADLLLFKAPAIEPSSVPQHDAFLESFDTTDKADSQTDNPVAQAVWGNGRIEAASVFPGPSTDAEIEIGPGTSNGNNVLFSTSVGVLKDKNGSSLSFSNGVIDCAKFTLKAPLAGKSSSMRGTGPLPLVIRARQSITIESGAILSVEGQSALDVSGLNTPNIPATPGSGACGGGSGGAGSPFTTESDPKGGDGNGAFETPFGGGKGGHSGFGNTGDIKNRPGGGGGGDWGVFELDGVGNFVAFCYSPSSCTTPGCPQPLAACTETSNCKDGVVPNPVSQGEDGALGVNTAIDAMLGTIPPHGGKKGPAVFVDGDPRNDFCGRKPDGTGAIFSGELLAIQGGQGGGGGGDSISGPNFPSLDFLQKDSRGGGGGGGGGVLVLQSLGTITVRGKVLADGGKGAIGEEQTAGSISGAGGGGGSGGWIRLESGTRIILGANATVSARGGNRGAGGGAYPGAPSSCTPGSECVKNCTASRGGAGGKGVIQVHVPFAANATVSCNGASFGKIQASALLVETDTLGTTQDILCERDPLFTAKFAPNNPHVLVPTFGMQSSVRSLWYATGWASLLGSPQFEFFGSDTQGNLDPLAPTTIASGSGGNLLGANTAKLTSALLADILRSAPQTATFDGLRATQASAIFRILNATVQGNDVILNTDPAQGLLPPIADWQFMRRSFEALSDGMAKGFPAGTKTQVLFEGADETTPGSHVPDLSAGSLVGPTADLSKLAGKDLIRFSVHFDRGGSVETPGLGFLKIGVRF